MTDLVVDSDKGVFKSILIVTGALVVFTMSIMFLARVIAPAKVYDDKIIRESLVSRIEAVGKIRTAADAGETEAAVSAVAVVQTPEEMYNGVCAACHATGIAGAPKKGDADAWAKRLEVGLDEVIASAVKGKGAMPAKGGSTFSDEDFSSVVKYLVGVE